MADNVLDLLTARYLRGTDAPSVRGILHEQPPATAQTTPTTGTTANASTTAATTTEKDEPPPPPPVTFVPLLERVGLPGVRRAAPNSIEWAKNITKLLTRIDPNDTERMTEKYKHFHSQILPPKSIVPGCFYTFRYEAQTINSFDRFPLIMALDSDQWGFFGMNFHYLPTNLRFALFEAMMPLTIPLPVVQRSRIYMTYQQLKRRNLIGKQATLKRYTFTGLRSGVVFIAPIEWAAAMAYPSETFINTNQVKVWAKSQKRVRGIR